MIWPHKMTLYNQTAAGYRRTVLSGVMWQESCGKVISKTGTDFAETVLVIIPYGVDAGGAVYKTPKDYQLDPSNAWTLQAKVHDFIVKGVCAYIPKAGDSIMELLKNYDAHSISSVSEYDYGNTRIRHWEVGGK